MLHQLVTAPGKFKSKGKMKPYWPLDVLKYVQEVPHVLKMSETFFCIPVF